IGIDYQICHYCQVNEFIELYPTYSRTKKRKGFLREALILSFPVIIQTPGVLAAFIHPSHLLQ
ncbi:MAG: hypothetical protein E7B34_31530, partial [Hafnia alvei]|nr:hypothetical protein [Hafnia alvei]